MRRTANHIIRENQSLRREWPDMLPEVYVAIGTMAVATCSCSLPLTTPCGSGATRQGR
jgi:hypothetical protein